MSVNRARAAAEAWRRGTDHQRRFAVLAAGVAAGGVVLGAGGPEFAPLMSAAASQAALIGLRWVGEACGVPAPRATGAAFAAAAIVAVATLGWWHGALWCGVLALAAAAVKANTAASAPVPDDEPFETPAGQDAADDAEFSQTRRRFEDVEVVEGVAAVADGPNHVVFHPPLGGPPEVELHPLDDLRVTLQETTPHGFRVSVKGEGRIAYAASASSSHSSHGSTISSVAG